ncbi:hypothetical protein MRX96_014964 [Rhipicephalus microplus]
MLAAPEASSGAEHFESNIEVISFGVTKPAHNRRHNLRDGHKPVRRPRSRLRKAIRRSATSTSRAHVKDMDGRNRRLPRVLNIEEVPGQSIPSSTHRRLIQPNTTETLTTTLIRDKGRSREAGVMCCTLNVSRTSGNVSLLEHLTASTDDIASEYSRLHNATTS